MPTPFPLAPRGLVELASSLQRALDRPARESIDVARDHPLSGMAPALLGVAGVALASAAAAALAPGGQRGSAAVDGLAAAGAGLVVALPGLMVFSTYLRVRASPGTLLAASGLGLLQAGVVSLALVPLVAFLAVTSHSEEAGRISAQLLIPGVALLSAVLAPLRVLQALDGSPRSRWVARLYALTAAAVFALQSHLPDHARAVARLISPCSALGRF